LILSLRKRKVARYLNKINPLFCSARNFNDRKTLVQTKASESGNIRPEIKFSTNNSSRNPDTRNMSTILFALPDNMNAYTSLAQLLDDLQNILQDDTEITDGNGAAIAMNHISRLKKQPGKILNKDAGVQNRADAAIETLSGAVLNDRRTSPKHIALALNAVVSTGNARLTWVLKSICIRIAKKLKSDAFSFTGQVKI
jgi:ElaB/YqjD/DUF883 family membrane-anchored ribosome-binding protein